jgi:hypothetical protein
VDGFETGFRQIVKTTPKIKWDEVYAESEIRVGTVNREREDNNTNNAHHVHPKDGKEQQV